MAGNVKSTATVPWLCKKWATSGRLETNNGSQMRRIDSPREVRCNATTYRRPLESCTLAKPPALHKRSPLPTDRALDQQDGNRTHRKTMWSPRALGVAACCQQLKWGTDTNERIMLLTCLPPKPVANIRRDHPIKDSVDVLNSVMHVNRKIVGPLTQPRTSTAIGVDGTVSSRNPSRGAPATGAIDAMRGERE